MTTQDKADYFGAVVVALLLILTAWGNAWVMLVASLVGLLLSIALFRKEVVQRGLLAASVACVLAFIIALVIGQR